MAFALRPYSHRPSPALTVGILGLTFLAGAAGNIMRKAVVQAPTALAGKWDEALAAEHRAALAIFDKLEQTDDTATFRRGLLLTQLKHALSKHALQEENAIYPALRDHGLADEADKLNHDHGYVKQHLYELTRMAKDDPRFLTELAEFRRLIAAHIREEEDELFPRLRQMVDAKENSALSVAMNKEGFKLA
jgi:hemerythrin superfamily protein